MDKVLSRDLGELKYSEITEEFPDREKYPLYYEASKHEITIHAGEKLFIPAGWFHFVFSEEVEESTGLNLALNFWFYPLNKWKPGDRSGFLPHKKKHDMNLSIEEIFGDIKVRCTYADLDGFFPSDRIFHRFPQGKMCHHYLTFDEFYETKNPKLYVIQHGDRRLEKYAPKYPTGIHIASAWANFGKSRSAIHYDEHDNWLYQLKGSKRVILFPQEDRHRLYLFKSLDSSRVINAILTMSNSPTYFILKTNEGGEEKDYAAVFKKMVQRYVDEREEMTLPLFDIPKEYRVHCTLGVNWFHRECNLPLVFMIILDGKGSLQLHKRAELEIERGDVILFPNHFTFPYQTSGNLKILVPT